MECLTVVGLYNDVFLAINTPLLCSIILCMSHDYVHQWLQEAPQDDIHPQIF